MAERRANAFEADARARKVAALVAEIDRELEARPTVLDPLLISAQVAAFSPSDWERIRRRALVNTPSDETIANVLRVYVRRAEESIEPEPASGEYASGEAFS